MKVLLNPYQAEFFKVVDIDCPSLYASLALSIHRESDTFVGVCWARTLDGWVQLSDDFVREDDFSMPELLTIVLNVTMHRNKHLLVYEDLRTAFSVLRELAQEQVVYSKTMYLIPRWILKLAGGWLSPARVSY